MLEEVESRFGYSINGHDIMKRVGELADERVLDLDSVAQPGDRFFAHDHSFADHLVELTFIGTVQFKQGVHRVDLRPGPLSEYFNELFSFLLDLARFVVQSNHRLEALAPFRYLATTGAAKLFNVTYPDHRGPHLLVVSGSD